MTPSSRRWPDAALLGFAGSMRTFTPAAMLAARGRISGPARYPIFAAALGELATDKTPLARERNDVPSTAFRVGSGALTGNAIAGPAGAVTGAASAAAGTFATYRARKLVCAATGLPDPVVAVAEDVIAITAAAVATREAPAEETDPRPEPFLRSAARGLAAGIAGTAAMTVVQGAYYQLTGAKPSAAPRQVADKALEAAGRGKVPRKHRTAANLAMHWAYGTSWGIPFGVIAGTRGAKPEPSGAVFGLVVWGAGLAQLPALGLAPAPWKQSPAALATDAGFHAVYGLGAAAALRALSPR